MTVGKDSKRCSVEGCAEHPILRLYEGDAYCRGHYDELLMGEFSAEYISWKEGDEPSTRLKYLFGRLSEEKWRVEGGLLSPYRIRGRGYSFRKTFEGAEFAITRHPGAWVEKLMNKVVQRWRVDIHSGVITLIGERTWAEGDPDL